MRGCFERIEALAAAAFARAGCGGRVLAILKTAGAAGAALVASEVHLSDAGSDNADTDHSAAHSDQSAYCTGFHRPDLHRRLRIVDNADPHLGLWEPTLDEPLNPLRILKENDLQMRRYLCEEQQRATLM